MVYKYIIYINIDQKIEAYPRPDGSDFYLIKVSTIEKDYNKKKEGVDENENILIVNNNKNTLYFGKAVEIEDERIKVNIEINNFNMIIPKYEKISNMRCMFFNNKSFYNVNMNEIYQLIYSDMLQLINRCLLLNNIKPEILSKYYMNYCKSIDGNDTVELKYLLSINNNLENTLQTTNNKDEYKEALNKIYIIEMKEAIKKYKCNYYISESFHNHPKKCDYEEHITISKPNSYIYISTLKLSEGAVLSFKTEDKSYEFKNEEKPLNLIPIGNNIDELIIRFVCNCDEEKDTLYGYTLYIFSMNELPLNIIYPQSDLLESSKDIKFTNMSDSLIYQSIIPSELSYSQCNITPVMINDSNIISFYIYIFIIIIFL